MNDMLNAPSAMGPGAVAPINKHGSVTQVSNGFVFYAGGATFVAYTFPELVGQLQTYFVADEVLIEPQPTPTPPPAV